MSRDSTAVFARTEAAAKRRAEAALRSYWRRLGWRRKVTAVSAERMNIAVRPGLRGRVPWSVELEVGPGSRLVARRPS